MVWKCENDIRSPRIMLSRMFSPNHWDISQITRKVGQCLYTYREPHRRIPSALIYSSIRNTRTETESHTRNGEGICKSCLKCITFGPIVCLGVAFRANFIPGKVEVAQLTSMQMAERRCARSLIYIESGGALDKMEIRWAVTCLSPGLMRGIMKTTCEIWNRCINWRDPGRGAVRGGTGFIKNLLSWDIKNGKSAVWTGKSLPLFHLSFRLSWRPVF